MLELAMRGRPARPPRAAAIARSIHAELFESNQVSAVAAQTAYRPALKAARTLLPSEHILGSEHALPRASEPSVSDSNQSGDALAQARRGLRVPTVLGADQLAMLLGAIRG